MIRTPWWFATLLGFTCVVVSIPTDGLLEAFFAVIGIAFLWIGWGKERRDREESDQ